MYISVLGVVLGIASAQLLAFIVRICWRRYRLPQTRAWLETEVLSPDGPIELKSLEYSWRRGYQVTLQWDDIDRVGIAKHKGLGTPLLLATFVGGVKSGVFLATEPAIDTA